MQAIMATRSDCNIDVQENRNREVRQWLLIRSQQEENCYGRFVEEILAGEGLNGFETADVDTDGMIPLRPGDLAVLTRCFLREAEMEELFQSVERGARLICFQPPEKFLERLGWTSSFRVLYPGRIRIRDCYHGAGPLLQTHVPIALGSPSGSEGGWEVIADAVADDGSESGYPAIVRRRVSAGEVVVFFYDLPKAVARIRFGDPELASHLSTGWGWCHAFDLFTGFLDDRVQHLPQADLHSQLLAQLLTRIAAYPLARFWYYERLDHRTAAVFSSDDDWSSPEEFQSLANSLAQRSARASFYLVKDTRLDGATIRELMQAGHTFAPHINAMEADGPYFNFAQSLREETELLQRRIGKLSVSLQTHCAPWYGYMSYARQCRQQGYRMLMHYMSFPSHRLNSFLCGSGRPMKFVDLHGVIYDCWQQPLVTFDDATVEERMTEGLDGLIGEFRSLLQGCLEDHHTAIGLASHPCAFVPYSQPFMEACFDMLEEAGAPIYNGDEWCAIQDRRRAAKVHCRISRDNRLTYTISELAGPLPLMIPRLTQDDQEWQVRINGAPAKGVRRQCLGEEYFFVQLEGVAGRKIRVEIGL